MQALRAVRRVVLGMGMVFGIGVIYSAEAQAALMAYWTFNDGSGTQLTDSSGRGNHGTLAGTTLPQWVPGRTGHPSDYALQFTGSTGNNDPNAPHVVLGNLPDLAITGNQTISMWLYPTNFSAGRQNPYAKAYGGTGTITQETNGYLTYYYGTAGTNGDPYQGVWSNAPLQLNQWNHIAVVRDFTNNQIRWYVNGVRTATVPPNFTSAAADSLPAYIGRGYVQSYRGRIDETAIFNEALQEVHVKAMASGELSPLTIMHYRTIREDWLEGWGYRQPIVIKKDAAQANLTGFPVPIKLTDPTNKVFAMSQSPQGYDIVFTSADGKTVLPFELEYFSKAPGSEQLYAWVKTNLSSTEDTTIYMYYGGPGKVNLSYKETWDNNFRIVQHMEEPAGATTFTDSTNRNRNMTAPNGATAGQAGIFYQAVDLGGYANQQYLRATGDSVPASSSFTIEGWAKIIDDESNQNQYPFAISERAAIRTMIGGSPRFGFIWRYSDGTYGGWDTSPARNLADGNWHYMVQVYDASQQKMYLYLDGQLISPAGGVNVSQTLASNNDYYVGSWHYAYGWVPGTFDEFRISDVARSAAWVRANWLLLSDPQTYLLFGAQQHVPEPATGTLALLALAGLAALVWRKKSRPVTVQPFEVRLLFLPGESPTLSFPRKRESRLL